MLEVLFPHAHERYAALPLLGSILDDFARWSLKQGYQRSTLRAQFKTMARVDRSLRRRGASDLTDITPEMLEACWSVFRRRNRMAGGIIQSLQRYLETTRLLQPPASAPSSPTICQLKSYSAYLTDVRGLAHNTRRNHIATVTAFLEYLDYDVTPERLKTITVNEVEVFVRRSGKRLNRGSLQHVAAHLRSFLRFLAVTSDGPLGLDKQVDTPRLYRLEQIPRALPWKTVQQFLQSIDRTDVLGLRDYAMFLLIASYGLRVREIATLTLDDVHWRSECIKVRSSKTSTVLTLPLSDDAATAVLDYLREGRPQVPHREIFLRVRAPIGPLKRTAVSMAFNARVKRSGLDIPYFGAHCLRHSYAVRLLRQRTPLKTIGDLLGHHTAEATCVYLRLATEDLREVPLPVPGSRDANAEEVRS